MKDTTFDALANERRREVLVALLNENPQPDRVGSSVGEDSDGPGDGAVDRTEMYHVHLPKLEATGLIEWHEHSAQVVTGPRFEQARPLIELVADHDGN